MNILPKKRWHVRTKENIARVRKDEAEAAEKEKQEQLRILNADREARLTILKNKSKQHLLALDIEYVKTGQDTVSNANHINLFEDLDHAVTSTNKEHDKEVRQKKEEYEKKIGYLTYLGQDTNEALKKKNWYEIPPQSSKFTQSEVKDTYDKLVLKDNDGKPKKHDIDEKNGEIEWNLKQNHDPLNTFRKYCTITNKTEKKTKYGEKSKFAVNNKCEKSKKHKEDNKNKKLQKLREARLKREQQEKHRTQIFLSKLNDSPTSSSSQNTFKITPKYNSQFNPDLAKQNYR